MDLIKINQTSDVHLKKYHVYRIFLLLEIEMFYM